MRVAFCLRDFIEGVDYVVDFQEKSPKMAAVLHINFKNVMPNTEEAEKIVKMQLKTYGIKLRIRKNIIGSAWYVNNTDPANPIKIKFQQDLSAYVWIGKTKEIVQFTTYINLLKEQQKHIHKKKAA
jgi:hypothetical protein